MCMLTHRQGTLVPCSLPCVLAMLADMHYGAHADHDAMFCHLQSLQKQAQEAADRLHLSLYRDM